jgi:mycothiol synthase
MPGNNMTEPSYIIRNYQPADFDNYVSLFQKAERLEPTGRLISPQFIKESLAKPNYSPQRDLFVVIKTGSIIGYMDLTPELGIRRVILDSWIHPDHRRKGLATRLLPQAMSRAREAGARVIHVNIMEDNAAAKTVLSKFNFKCVRKFFQLKLDMTRMNREEANHALQESHYLRRGEEEKLTHIQNRSFAGTWGYNPNTIEMITYRTNLSRFSLEDVLLAHEGGKVIGYCWTEKTGEREGQIYMLGIDPDYRGKGIGRRLLLAGLAHLKSKGSQVAVLTVDSENEEACSLYDSVGFELQASSLWYEKSVT